MLVETRLQSQSNELGTSSIQAWELIHTHSIFGINLSDTFKGFFASLRSE
ncbi:MAG: hypothetical protein PHC83_05360 [Bacteroidales bacterium]|nr:hypothetical protein [Bacteroidales bacterium]